MISNIQYSIQLYVGLPGNGFTAVYTKPEPSILSIISFRFRASPKFFSTVVSIQSLVYTVTLLLLAGMESVIISLDSSSSSIVANVISDDKNVTNFGSLEKFLHLIDK